MARTMPLAKIICLFACSLGLQCLVQQCTTAADCPANAFCSNNTYCICDANWIGACNVPSVPLASTISQVFETGQTILFQINPITLNSNLLFGFLICQANASSLNLTINLWFETGSITEYNSSNALNTPYNSQFRDGCTQLILTDGLMFQRQPNGQYEQLILGITDNGVPATLNLTESQQIGGEPHIFYYLTIGLVVFISVSFVGGLISCAFFRRRRAARSPVVEVSLCHDISHFDNFMPSCVAEGVVEDKSLCSICLGVIMPADYVRKMSCNHIFHSSCIDAWCIKSINCPICRADFSLQTLRELKQHSLQSRDSHRVSDWEGVQMGVPVDLNSNRQSGIRQSML